MGVVGISELASVCIWKVECWYFEGVRVITVILAPGACEMGGPSGGSCYHLAPSGGSPCSGREFQTTTKILSLYASVRNSRGPHIPW